MHHGPLFAQGQARGYGQDQPHDLDDQRPLAQVAPDDKPT
jgi:hypothetical protein